MSLLFQSTHPHGVRPCAIPRPPITHSCFNPRTHTGCDAFASKPMSILRCFNPRTHTGCDPYHFQPVRHGFQVSIHAPTRGATDYLFIHIITLWFQSTHPHGVRLYDYAERVGEHEFQSTHPHGVRPLFRVRFHSAILVSIHAPTRGATPV